MIARKSQIDWVSIGANVALINTNAAYLTARLEMAVTGYRGLIHDEV